MESILHNQESRDGRESRYNFNFIILALFFTVVTSQDFDTGRTI